MPSSQPLPLLVLTGTPYQIGLQHGHLMRQEIVNALSNRSQSIGVLLARAGVREEGLRPRLESMAALLPESVREELHGVADGSDVPVDSLVYHNLILEIAAEAAIGCSQFAAFGSATVTGELLHAHNLDIPYMVIREQAKPACIICCMDGYVPYLSISFWPGAVGVVTGMNALGLSLGINRTVGPKDLRPHFPSLILNRVLLAETETVAEARTRLQSVDNGGNWNLMVADRSGAMVWEQSGPYSAEYGPAPGSNHLISTNHWTQLLKGLTGYEQETRELLQQVQEHSLRRYARLESLLNAANGAVDLPAALAMLRDCNGTEGGNAPSMSTVCRVDNALSAVYLPQQMAVDLAAGEIPAALGPRRRIELGPLFRSVATRTAIRVKAEPRGQFPMLSEAKGNGRWERTFDFAEDIYLEHHLVNQIPVLPGASAIEWMAEVATQAGQGGVREVRNVEFERFLRIQRDRPVRAWVEAQQAGDLWNLAAYADVIHPTGKTLSSAVRHYRAQVQLGPRIDELVEPRFRSYRIPDEDPSPDGTYLDSSYFWVGPRFRLVDWARFLNPQEVIGRLQAHPMTGHFASAPRARFWFDPFRLDGCFQIAGLIGILNNLRCPVPKALGRLRVGREAQPTETLWCKATMHRIEDPFIFFDFVVWGEDNRICYECRDYCSVSVDGYSQAEKEHLTHRLDPHGRLMGRKGNVTA